MKDFAKKIIGAGHARPLHSLPHQKSRCPTQSETSAHSVIIFLF